MNQFIHFNVSMYVYVCVNFLVFLCAANFLQLCPLLCSPFLFLVINSNCGQLIKSNYIRQQIK